MSADPKPEPALELVRDGVTLEARWRVHTFRFLLSDGRVADVRSFQDDSRLRAEVLRVMRAERIEGVARVPAELSLELEA